MYSLYVLNLKYLSVSSLYYMFWWRFIFPSNIPKKMSVVSVWVLSHSINSISFSSYNTMVYWLLLFSGNCLFWYEFSLKRGYFNSFDEKNKISHWESRWKYISCSAAGSRDNDSSVASHRPLDPCCAEALRLTPPCLCS